MEQHGETTTGGRSRRHQGFADRSPRMRPRMPWRQQRKVANPGGEQHQQQYGQFEEVQVITLKKPFMELHFANTMMDI